MAFHHLEGVHREGLTLPLPHVDVAISGGDPPPLIHVPHHIADRRQMIPLHQDLPRIVISASRQGREVRRELGETSGMPTHS